MEKQMIRNEKGCSSEIRSAIEEVSLLLKTVHVIRTVDQINNNHDHTNDHLCSVITIPTKPFLSLCTLLLQVLDKIGPTMAVLRQDVHQNIQRLEKVYETDPMVYSNMVEIVKKEVKEGIAKKGHTCSKSIVWLTRSLDFGGALLKKIGKEDGVSMEKAVEDAYNVTLKPWHRWISSAAFKVGIRLVPDYQSFISLLLAKEETHESLKENIQTLVLLIVPLLEDIHCALRYYGLDKIRST